MQRALPLVLVFVGLAGLARGQEEGPIRGRWKELFNEWKDAKANHTDTMTEIVRVQTRLGRSEQEVAPLYAEEEQLRKTCEANDPRLSRARLAIAEKVNKLSMGEDRALLTQLTQQAIMTRAAAIASGTAALHAVLGYLERMEEAKGLAREAQVAEARSDMLALNKELDKLESDEDPPVRKFVALAAPNTPRRIGELMALYDQDARNAERVAAVLSERAAQKRVEKDHLVKLIDRAAKVEGLEERLKVANARLERLEAARSEATKHAEDERLEISKLKAQKAQLEHGMTKD